MKPNPDRAGAPRPQAEQAMTLDSAMPGAGALIGELAISGASVGQLGDALVLVGRDGAILDADVSALELYGYSHEEMLAMRLSHLETPQHSDDLDDLLRWEAEAGAFRESMHVHRDGTRLPVVARSLPALGREGTASLMVVRAAGEALREHVVSELFESEDRLREMAHSIAEAMGRVVETRDPYTRGHEARVATFAKLVAMQMGLPEDDVIGVEIAAAVHDIGKISVPAEILCKPGLLSSCEMKMIRQHPTVGYEILKDIAFPWPIAESVLQHHERMDGSGYPRGLVGDEISTAARILAVADAVEAMASDRPYRPALGIDAAIGELLDNPEAYDQTVVEACLGLHGSGRIVW